MNAAFGFRADFLAPFLVAVFLVAVFFFAVFAIYSPL